MNMIVRSTLHKIALKYPSMKKLSFVLITAFGIFTATFCSPLYAANILVFGDSLSAGYGLQAEEDWPTLLKQRLQAEQPGQYTVINSSISGETTAGGLSRFAKTFSKYKPSIVILELGANDGLQGQPLNTMRKNLGKMIEYSLKNEARVLLVSMKIPPNYGKRYTSEFQQSFPELQQEYNIYLTDFLLGNLSGRPELFQKDGLHPAAEAQPILLETVWKSLKPLLQKPR